MISYEEALRKAKMRLNGINYCEEYDTGYVFSHVNKTKSEKTRGGMNTPVAVLKKNGRVEPVYEFMMEEDSELIKEFEVK